MSVLTFEIWTEDLTEREIEYIPLVQEAIEKALRGAMAPRKQHELITLINAYLHEKEGMFCALSLTGPRLRKYINHLRSNAILPIIATSDGYSITETPETIQIQIKSLMQRSRQIARAAEGLQKYLNQKA